MKRLIIINCYVVFLLAGFTSCNKQLKDDYYDPEKTTIGYPGQLFTYMLNNDRILPTYWDYATFITGVTAKYSQIFGISTSFKMYQPSAGYNQDRWTSYYTNGILNQYREIQKNYNNLSPLAKPDQYVFTQVSKVVFYDQTAQMVDLWGDIPFSEAGSLNATNIFSTAKFDDAASIYNTIISDLKDLNMYFDTVKLSNASAKSLAAQDILLKGNLTLWRKYTNSLRLRLLMRISNVDEATAKAAVTEMLNDQNTYPLVNNNDENILLKMNPPSFKSDIRDGLTDLATSSGPVAPAYLLETVMVANNDPRTPVLWDPGILGTYKGLDPLLPADGQDSLISKHYVSNIDSATFTMNYNVPGTLFTAAEVSFLKAEAYERWNLGTAQTAYETGIKQSIAFYYSLNQSAIFRTPFSKPSLPTPDDATINAFIAGSGIAYSGTPDQKIQKIWTQKWLNFFVLQAGQAWTEVRRTGYPALTFATDGSGVTSLPPKRLMYPDTEKSYNTENYNAVSSKDTPDKKIFWEVN